MVLKHAKFLGVVAWLLIKSGFCYADSSDGAGSSGGGRILKDAHNPWFLENTHEVGYCIVHNATDFSLAIDQVRLHIAEAFSFWTEQLQKGNYTDYSFLFKGPQNSFRLGTQRFVETPCDQNPSIVFQLGSLSPQQKERIEGVDTTIAEVVRTNYDRVNLRGSGFVYVASDRGPLWEGSKIFAENTWATLDGKTFYFSILHELGHIFGLPDTSAAPLLMTYGWVQMKVDYVSKLEPEFAKYLHEPEITEWTRPMFDDFGFCRSGGVVGPYEKWRERVLGIPAVSEQCERTQIVDEKLQIYAGPSRDQMNLVGSGTFNTDHRDDGQTLISVWLPQEQKIYQLRSGETPKRVPIYDSVRTIVREVQGTFRVQASGFETPFVMKLNPSELTWFPMVMGVVDGKLYTDLIHPQFGVNQVKAASPGQAQPDPKQLVAKMLAWAFDRQ